MLNVFTSLCLGNVVKGVCCSVHLLFKEISKTNCYVNNTGFPPEMLELVVGKGVEEDTVNSLHCLLKKNKKLRRVTLGKMGCWDGKTLVETLILEFF